MVFSNFEEDGLYVFCSIWCDAAAFGVDSLYHIVAIFICIGWVRKGLIILENDLGCARLYQFCVYSAVC